MHDEAAALSPGAGRWRASAGDGAQEVHDVLLGGEDAEAVARAARVEETVCGGDAGADGEPRGPLGEDGLRGGVRGVPVLGLVAEEEGHAFDVQLPCRVEALVVEVREPADGGGEMARVADGAVECVSVRTACVGGGGYRDLKIKFVFSFSVWIDWRLTFIQNVPRTLFSIEETISISFAPRSERCLEGADIIIHYRSLVFVHHLDLEIGMLGHVLDIPSLVPYRTQSVGLDRRPKNTRESGYYYFRHSTRSASNRRPKDSHKRDSVVDLRNEIRVARADEVHLGETRGADELNGHIDELAAVRQKNLVHDALRLVFHRRRRAVNEARHSC